MPPACASPEILPLAPDHIGGSASDDSLGRPNRVMAYHLASSLKRIDSAIVLERADPRMSSPTEGTIVGASFYFIANSQQRAFGSDHRLWPSSKLANTSVLELKLSTLGH